MSRRPEDPAFPDTREGAIAALQYLANDEVNEAVAKSVAGNTGRWTPDPYIENVWGFHLFDDPDNFVRLVVYLDEHDFEVDDLWVDDVIQ